MCNLISNNQIVTSSRSQGFTLIELMVVIAIFAILAALAQPSFSRLIERYRANSAAEGLVSSWNLARSEGMARGGGVKLVADVACSSNQWECGWRIEDAAGAVIQRIEPRNGVVITNDTTGTITFNRSGWPTTLAQSFLVKPTSSDGTDYTTSVLLCVGAGGQMRKLSHFDGVPSC